MATTHATNFQPYLQRTLSLAKFSDETHFYMNLIKDHFFDHDSYMFYLAHRDMFKKFIQELRMTYDQSSQLLAGLRLKQFYHEVFGKTIDIDQMAAKINVNTGLRLMYIPWNLSIYDIIEVITKKYFAIEFNGDSKSCLDKVNKRERGYFFWWNGYKEHTRETSGMRLEGMINSGFNYMDVTEYLLTRLFQYWLTGKNFDEKGFTLLDAETKSRASIVVSSQYSNCVFSSIARDEGNNHPPAGPRRIDLIH